MSKETAKLNMGNVGKWNEEMSGKSPQEVVEWAHQQFGEQVVLACSFGAEDIALVDMYCQITKSPRIFYLDTDLHFQETYETRDRLQDHYKITFIQMKSAITLEEQAKIHGAELWKRDPNLCCNLRKVEPLKQILKKNQAWITGIRRQQSPTRANAQKIEWDQNFEMVKVNPLVHWSTKDVWNYVRANDVPYNPLHDQNYPSIGCSVCTKPVAPGEDSRSGRWAGFTKTECGLHR
jgi:phosphoadenosine phosphosulfate reductase